MRKSFASETGLVHPCHQTVSSSQFNGRLWTDFQQSSQALFLAADSNIFRVHLSGWAALRAGHEASQTRDEEQMNKILSNFGFRLLMFDAIFILRIFLIVIMRFPTLLFT